MPGTSPCGRSFKRFPKPPSPYLPREPATSPRHYSELRASAVIALAATLNLDIVAGQVLTDLPPSIWPQITILGDIDWRNVCYGAIRAQAAMLAEQRDTNPLLRTNPWELRAFFNLGGEPFL
jgi:hypothetical protein